MVRASVPLPPNQMFQTHRQSSRTRRAVFG